MRGGVFCTHAKPSRHGTDTLDWERSSMKSRFNLRRPTIVAGVLALALGTTALTAIPGTAQPTPTPVAGVALPRPAGPDFADVAARATSGRWFRARTGVHRGESRLRERAT